MHQVTQGVEILLTGCPTVGIRTGASLVRHGVTGVLVERLPPGKACIEHDRDEAALVKYLEAIRQAPEMDRVAVRVAAAAEFDTDRIVDRVLAVLEMARSP